MKPYTPIENLFLDKFLPILSGNAVKLFLAIARKTIGWHKESDKISNGQLLTLSGLTCRHILLKTMKELLELKLIKVERVGRGKAIQTYYKITLNGGEIALLEPEGIKFNGGDLPLINTPIGGEIPLISGFNGGDLPPTKESNIKKEDLKEREAQSFDKFYSAYPLKKSKEAARKAFTKLNPSTELLQIILDAIENQKQERENQRQRGIEPSFLKHPATWLNGKCWEDEVNLTINPEKQNATYQSNFRESPAQARLRSANEFADKKLRECLEQRKQREAGNNERTSEDESGIGF